MKSKLALEGETVSRFVVLLVLTVLTKQCSVMNADLHFTYFYHGTASIRMRVYKGMSLKHTRSRLVAFPKDSVVCSKVPSLKKVYSM